MPTLTLGTQFNGVIKDGQDLYYRVDVPTTGDLLLTANFAVTQEAELYVKRGSLPTRGSFDDTASNLLLLHRELLLQSPQPGPVYILLHGRSGASTGKTFNLKVESDLFDLRSFTPVQGANVGPVTVTLKDASGVNWWATRTVRANYVVGCDGAHSAVRKSIGGVLHGDAANQAWGVMDILANTDFPDVRQKCLISSASEGNVLILPREGGYVFRMYVELDKLRPDEKAASRKFTQDDMIAAANRIIRPYSIDVKEVVWWSIYDIGHSITDKFDDVPDGSARDPRVFTAGDACHTHSPKAGQGMNVSMQDTFNLGWKLVHVLQGRADASLLRSYSKERLTEARRLVETDHEWARIMSAPTTQAERDGTEEPRIIRQFKQNLEFTGGTAVKYDPSKLFAVGTWQALARGLEIGRRFHSAPVVRLADAKQMQLGHVAEADARWRIYAFAGKADSSDAGSAIHKLADWMETSANSPVVRHTRKDEDIDALIDFRAVFQQTFEQLAFENMPSLLRPKTGKLGLADYEKVFCVDHKGVGDIFDMRGINRDAGCMVVVRPDQYVAHVLPLDGFGELSAFFSGFLR